MTAVAIAPARLGVSPGVAGFGWGLLAAAIWGGYLAFARAGIAGGLAPVDFLLLRFGVAGLLVLPFITRGQVRTLGGVGWPRGLALAALAGPCFILLGTLGYRYAPLAHGAVVQPAMVTIGALLLAMVVLRERVAARRWAGVAIVVAGLVVVSGAGLAEGAWRGDLAFAVAGLLWAGFTVASRAWGVRPMTGTIVVAALGGAVAVPAWLVWGDASALLAQGWGVLATQAAVQGVLSGLVAVYAFSRAVALIGPVRAALFPAMVPGLAMLAGIPVAGEWPTAQQWLGLGIVLAGLPMAMGLWRRVTPRP